MGCTDSHKATNGCTGVPGGFEVSHGSEGVCPAKTSRFETAKSSVICIWSFLQFFLVWFVKFTLSACVTILKQCKAPPVYDWNRTGGNFVGSTSLSSSSTILEVHSERAQLSETEEDEEMSFRAFPQDLGPVSTHSGPRDPLLAKQKECHRKGYDLISKALTIDENKG